MGRLDFYPHLSLPLAAGGWSIVPEVALRDTFYTISQIPDLTGARSGTPTISHDSLNRTDVEASVDIRPPALERDFALPGWNRELRHVIEPELTYRYVGGIGAQAQQCASDRHHRHRHQHQRSRLLAHAALLPALD